jgi:hypothetical protein
MSPVFFFFRRGVEEKSDEAKSPQKSNEEISASRFFDSFFCVTRDARDSLFFWQAKKQLKCPFCSFFLVVLNLTSFRFAPKYEPLLLEIKREIHLYTFVGTTAIRARCSRGNHLLSSSFYSPSFCSQSPPFRAASPRVSVSCNKTRLL